MTGDSLLTACHVAGEVGLIAAGGATTTRPERSTTRKRSSGKGSPKTTSPKKYVSKKKEPSKKKSSRKGSLRKGPGFKEGVGKSSLLLTMSEGKEVSQLQPKSLPKR